MVSPNGGEKWWIGSSRTITWASNEITSVKVEVSLDSGSTWSIIAESIDAGADLVSWTVPDNVSADCLVRITSTTGDYSDVSDSSFSIIQEPYIKVTAPDGGEKWLVGSEQSITWESRDVTAVKIELSPDSGSNWSTLSESIDAAEGSFSWTIPDMESFTCLIRITDTEETVISDTNDNTFSVTPEPFLQQLSPNGGEEWITGESQNVTWNSAGVELLRIEFTDDSGSNWISLAKDVDAATGSYGLEVPYAESSVCLIRIMDMSFPDRADVSDNPFTILTFPVVELTAPDGGEEWMKGTIQTITWTSEWITNILIEYSVDNGTSWKIVVESTDASAGSYAWTIPDDISSSCLVRLTDTDKSDVTDSSRQTFSIVPEPFLTLISPNGGEDWEVGSSRAITWEFYGVDNMRIEFSSDGGKEWINIVDSGDTLEGKFIWTVPDVESSECLIRITDTSDTARSDVSDAVFGISKRNFIHVTSPADGERLETGSLYNIRWESSGAGKVNIDYSSNGGSSWSGITKEIDAALTTYNWTVPDNISSSCLIRITDTVDANLTDTSDDIFLIVLPSTVNVTAPNGGEEWVAGTAHDITWESSNVTLIGIDYSSDDGSTWKSVIKSVNASIKLYSWEVPDDVSSNCLVRVFVEADSNHLDVSDGTFTISPEPFVSIIAPNGGEMWSSGSTQNITWSSSGVANIKVEYSLNGGVNWMTLIGSTDAATGSYSWKVPDIESSQCLVRIADLSDPNRKDVSEATFTISPAPFVEISSPNGSELWIVGESRHITWTFSGVSSIKLDYSVDGGTSWITLVQNIDASTGSYQLTVPDAESPQCLVRIVDNDSPGRMDISDGTFTITPLPSITITYPNGGEKLTINSTEEIFWSSTGIKTVRLEYSPDNGQSWTEIGSNVDASTGIYSWSVADTPSTECIVRITSMENLTITDQSDDTFTITEEPFVELVTPNGGESWIVGTKEEITWIYYEVNNVQIEYSPDGGTTWIIVASSADARTKSYIWTLPDIESTHCFVRITDKTDANRVDMSDATFTIALSAFVELISPGGGETWTIGSTQTIRWSSSGILNVKLEYSTDAGQTWNEIISSVDAGSGSFSWTIPDQASEECTMRISNSADALVYDENDEPFSIILSHYISIIAPSGGDKWTVGASHQILWNYNGISDVKIELSTDSGTNWQLIESSTSASTGSYTWIVTGIQSVECKVRLSDVSNPEIYDINDGFFEIFKPVTTIEHEPVAVADENSSISFNVKVTSSTAINTVYLYYDITGTRKFNKHLTFITENGVDYSAILPIGVFTADGLEYYIVARDKSGVESRMPVDSGFYSINAHVTNIVSIEIVHAGSEQNAYRMISVPLVPLYDSIVEQLTERLPEGKSGSDWRLFRYPKGSATPVEYPDAEGFFPGKAFWLITTQDYRFRAPEGETVTTSESFTLELAPGWNDIGNPWIFDISWDNKVNPSSANLDVLYTYEGSWSDPSNPPGVLEPWKGYAVRNMENRNVIIRLNPVPVNGITKPATPDDEVLWYITIIARAGEAVDSGNRLGVSYKAEKNWDEFDHVEPPPVGKFVSVSFPHYDWERYSCAYTVDFRPPASTISWDFDVKTNISKETVSVELEGSEQLPDGLFINIIDRDGERNVDIEENTFNFISGGELTERHFSIVVSDSQEPEQEPDLLRPEQFVTAKCFPNPFNPQTTIQYELSHSGKVKISVFNSLGQRVQIYEPGHREQGIHELVFDASELTSGLYFYHVDAGYSSVKGKMLLMK